MGWIADPLTRRQLLALAAAAGVGGLPTSGWSEEGGGGVGRYRRPKNDRPLPDGRVARGTRNIAAAWLSEPTVRYRHFALGSEHEAGVLNVSMTDRRLFRLTLPADSVFEDREPRLWDVDGDGLDEVVVVRSYLKAGAALAIAAVRPDAGLVITVETPPIGVPFRWLNPAGAADFDGDGKPEIALVRTPHTMGELQIWGFGGSGLTLLAALEDCSNHVQGSPDMRLSAVADFDGDGIADLAVPSLDRRSLRFISFKGRRLREIHRVELPGRAAEAFVLVERQGRPAVNVGLAGGRRTIVGL